RLAVMVRKYFIQDGQGNWRWFTAAQALKVFAADEEDDYQKCHREFLCLLPGGAVGTWAIVVRSGFYDYPGHDDTLIEKMPTATIATEADAFRWLQEHGYGGPVEIVATLPGRKWTAAREPAEENKEKQRDSRQDERRAASQDDDLPLSE